MKALVVGGGGREHALAWKLSLSPRVQEVCSCPGNPGMARHGECWSDLSPRSDFSSFLDRIRQQAVDFVVVGPEAPLVDGLADRLREQGVATFGPGAAASQLEGSKAYSKAFMERHAIPTARYRRVDRVEDLSETLSRFEGPVVVKASGLAAGKGVIIADDATEAEAAARSMLVDRRFGAAGETVVLEEKLVGVEMTMLVFVSGRQYLPLDSAQDYKPRLEGNLGPNTGGMGAFSPSHLLSPELRETILKRILEPTLAGLEADGISYRGILYLGLMLTSDGPQVLEYNVRFGDPETQPLLLRLRTDLVDVMERVETGDLSALDLRWDPRAAICLVLASEGYPEGYETGKAVDGPTESDPEEPVQVFHAGTRRDDNGRLVTSGGRVFGVTALGEDLPSARAAAYARAEEIQFDGKVFRRDIGLYGTSTDSAPVA